MIDPCVSLTNRERVYQVAKDSLGKNLCENRILGCMESVNAVVSAAVGQSVGGGASTWLGYQALLNNPNRFMKVDKPLPGDIIMSPSGTSSIPDNVHGHTGIVGIYGVLSNSSSTGLFEEKYTLQSWLDFFCTQEGFPVYYFRVL